MIEDQLFLHRRIFLKRLVVAVAAEGLVDILFAEDDEFLGLAEAVGMIGECAAADADGMDLLDILRNGEEAGDRTEGLAEIVGVEAGADDADAAVGEGLGHLDEALIEELGLVYAYDLHIIVDLEHPGRGFDGRTGNAVRIVGDHVKV